MVEWLEQTITSLGYGGIMALMFVANFIPFFPSDLIMPFAGFVVSRGNLSFTGVVIAGTLGSVAGQVPPYYLGRLIGQEQLKRWLARYGRWFSISPATIDRAQLWFDQYGEQAVLVCRLIPTVRSLISIPAGIAHMSLPRYLLYSTLGIGIWNLVVVYLGRLLGENYARASEYLDTAAYLALAAIIVVGVVWWIYRRRKESSRPTGASEG